MRVPAKYKGRSVRLRHREAAKYTGPLLCPDCGHEVEEHNQIGCCYRLEACVCLKSRMSIEDGAKDA